MSADQFEGLPYKMGRGGEERLTACLRPKGIFGPQVMIGTYYILASGSSRVRHIGGIP
jgi:hypothetical protein